MDGWSDNAANQIYELGKQHLRDIARDPRIAARLQDVGDIEKDEVGMQFKPFGTHNYLYGHNLKKFFADEYEIANNTKHPEHDKWIRDHQDFLEFFQKNGSNTDFESMLHKTFGPRGFLNLVLHPGVSLGQQGDAIALRAFLLGDDENDGYASFQRRANLSSFVVAPLMILGQLAVSGWKKTAWTWGVGIGVTEGVSYGNQTESGTRRITGWSIITYGIIGHFFMELYKKPKLRKIMNLFKYPEFIPLSMGAYGLFETIGSLIADPGYPVGNNLGIHHGYHHLGIAYGAWLNR